MRKAQGWTLQQLADEVQCSYQQVHKLEKGMRNLTLRWMQRLATALKCRPEDLIAQGTANNDTAQAGGLQDSQNRHFATAQHGVATSYVPFASVTVENNAISLRSESGASQEVLSTAISDLDPASCHAISCSQIGGLKELSDDDVVIITTDVIPSRQWQLTVLAGRATVVANTHPNASGAFATLLWKCGKAL